MPSTTSLARSSPRPCRKGAEANWPSSRKLTPGVPSSRSAALRARGALILRDLAHACAAGVQCVHFDLGFHRANAQGNLDRRLAAGGDNYAAQDRHFETGDNDGDLILARGERVEDETAFPAGGQRPFRLRGCVPCLNCGSAYHCTGGVFDRSGEAAGSGARFRARRLLRTNEIQRPSQADDCQQGQRKRGFHDFSSWLNGTRQHRGTSVARQRVELGVVMRGEKEGRVCGGREGRCSLQPGRLAEQRLTGCRNRCRTSYRRAAGKRKCARRLRMPAHTGTSRSPS